MTVREFFASPVWVLGTFNVLGLTGLSIYSVLASDLFIGVHVLLFWFLLAYTVGRKYWKAYRASQA